MSRGVGSGSGLLAPNAVEMWSTRRLGGGAAFPLVVLFALNLVDELDRAAFAALAPEIRDEFGLGDSQIAAVAALASLAVVVFAIPLGVLADRTNRVRLAAACASLWGLMTLLTGVAPAVTLLVAARVMSGVGRLGGEVVHPTLLTDMYPLRVRPRVFQIHRSANTLGAAGGLVAGALAGPLGWRGTFVMIATPAVALVPLAFRIREPGRSDGATAPRRLAPRAAIRAAVAMRSVRRVCLVALLLGVTYVSSPPFLSLFFENEHASSPLVRGVVQALFGGGVLLGLLLGAPLARRTIGRSAHGALAQLCAAGFVLVGLGFVLVGAVPGETAAMAFVPVLAVGIGLFQPAYFTLIGLLAPARIRGTVFSAALVCVGAGGFAGVLAVLVAEQAGYRRASLLLTASALAAAAAALSLRSLLASDLETRFDVAPPA